MEIPTQEGNGFDQDFLKLQWNQMYFQFSSKWFNIIIELSFRFMPYQPYTHDVLDQNNISLIHLSE